MTKKKTLINPDLVQYKSIITSSIGTLGNDFNPASGFWDNIKARHKEILEAVEFSYRNGFKDREKTRETIEHGGSVKFLFHGRKKFSEQKEYAPEQIARVLGYALLKKEDCQDKNYQKYLEGLDRFPMLQEYKLKSVELLHQGQLLIFSEMPRLDTRGEALMQMAACFTTFFSPRLIFQVYQAGSAFAPLALNEVNAKYELMTRRADAVQTGTLAEADQKLIDLLEYNLNELKFFVSRYNKQLMEQCIKNCQRLPEIFIDYQKLNSDHGIAELCENNGQSNINEVVKVLTQYRNNMTIGFVRELMDQVIGDILDSPVLANNPAIRFTRLKQSYEQIVQIHRKTGDVKVGGLLKLVKSFEQCLIAPGISVEEMSEVSIQFHNMSVYRSLALATRFYCMRSMDVFQADPKDVFNMSQKTHIYFKKWGSTSQMVKLSQDARQKLNEELNLFQAHWERVEKQLLGADQNADQNADQKADQH